MADWADLAGSSRDPDHMVDWDDVVLVELGAAEPLRCPVCLDDRMTAPQVTLCGHAFCFPCVARHAVTNRAEGEPAKCPMCFQPLRLADLRRAATPITRGRAPRTRGNDGGKKVAFEGGKLSSVSDAHVSGVAPPHGAVPVAAATRARSQRRAARHRAAAHLAGADDRAAVTSGRQRLARLGPPRRRRVRRLRQAAHVRARARREEMSVLEASAR